MTNNQEIGRQGEQLARQYLLDNDYAILETNWKKGKNEVDIIAYRDETIVFVEVKTRSGEQYGTPESAVDAKKQRTYIRMADAYVVQNKRTEEVRFDIISIESTNGKTEIKHLVDAFNTITAG